MRYFLAATDISVLVEFRENDELIVPDPGSVTYSLFGNDGQVMEGFADQAANPGSNTQVAVAIAAVQNTKADGRDTEQRTLIVSYKVGGNSYSIRQSWLIHDFLNYATSEAAVRQYLGLNRQELPDQDVDLVAAYFTLASKIPNFREHLADGGMTSIFANNALVFQASLDLLLSVPGRVAQRSGTDNTFFERFGEAGDWAKVERKTRELLLKVVNTLTGTDEALPVVSQFSTRTDPITGA